MNWRDLWTSVALFVGFVTLYLLLGLLLTEYPGYHLQQNIFFEADHLESLDSWHRFEGGHGHKGSHPLLLLLVVPPTFLLAALLPGEQLAVLLLNAVYGATAVVLAFRAIDLWIGRRLLATLSACFFGVSMSQLTYGAVPESYSLAGATLAATYLLTIVCMKDRQLRFWYWVLVATLSFGVLITNAVQALICFCGVLVTIRSRDRRLAPLFSLGVAVFFIALALTGLQRLIFPTSAMFFIPSTIGNELEYVTPLVLTAPGTVAREVLMTFFVFNFVGSLPTEHLNADGVLQLSYFRAPIRMSIPGIAALLLWLGLLVGAVVESLAHRRTRPLELTLGLAVLFSIGLHALYGAQYMFLYATNFTLAVLLLAVNRPASERANLLRAWAVLVALTIANNAWVVWKLAGVGGSM